MPPALRLTKDLTLDDLTVTEAKLGNAPPAEQHRILLFLASYLLQPIISKFGRCAVTSAYRSPAVNKKIGGSPTSQHPQAEACDLIPLKADIKAVFHWCRQNLIFGQLIFETKGTKQWIHISLPRLGKENMQVLVYDGATYHPYQEGLL